MTRFDPKGKALGTVVLFCAAALLFAACGKSKEEAAASDKPAPDAFAGWMEYGSDPQGFTVMVPKSMDLYRDKSQTAAGEIEILTFLAEMPTASYGVVCNDFPQDFLAKADTGEMLANGIKGFVSKLSGTLDAERPVTLDGNAGREIVMTGSSQGVALYGKARFFLIGARLYQVAYIAEKGKEDPAAVDHFLDSFKLK